MCIILFKYTSPISSLTLIHLQTTCEFIWKLCSFDVIGEDDWFLPECTNSGTNRSCLSSYYIVTASVMALQSSPAEQGAAVLLSSWITWPLNRILRIQLSMTTCTFITRTQLLSILYLYETRSLESNDYNIHDKRVL